jgi:hypothetical protein
MGFGGGGVPLVLLWVRFSDLPMVVHLVDASFRLPCSLQQLRNSVRSATSTVAALARGKSTKTPLSVKDPAGFPTLEEVYAKMHKNITVCGVARAPPSGLPSLPPAFPPSRLPSLPSHVYPRSQSLPHLSAHDCVRVPSAAGAGGGLWAWVWE